MHVLIVHCHPEPASFNAALRDVAIRTLEAAGHTTEVSDLYAEDFDPRESPAHFVDRVDPARFAPLDEQRHAHDTATLAADVERELDRLERADLVVFQYPLWWHGTPAMLKGWIDRVFVYGGRYTGRMRYDRGYFRGRRAICSVTTGAPPAAFSRYGRNGHMEQLMLPMHYSLYYVGFDVLPPFVAYGVQGGGIRYEAEERFRAGLEADKAAWSRRLAALDGATPLPFTGWDDWDEQGVIRAEHPARWHGH